MTTKWTPGKGQLFYVKINDRLTEHPPGPFSDTVIVTREKDGSHSTTIFRMIAQDDTMAFAEVVYDDSNYMMGKKSPMSKSKVTFHPVGPDIAKALNLIDEQDTVRQ